MRKLIILLLLFIGSKSFAQTNPTTTPPVNPQPMTTNTVYQEALTKKYFVFNGSTFGWRNLTDSIQVQRMINRVIGASYNFSNGLTNDGSGNVKLGGTITEATFLNSATSPIFMGDLSGQTATFGLFTGATAAASMGINNGTRTSSLTLGGVGSAMSLGQATITNTQPQGFVIDNSGKFYAQDARFNKGLVYNANYATNGTADDRWIPDWGAVKNLVTGNGVTASNGLNKNVNDIQLGGDITDDININNPDSKNFYINGGSAGGEVKFSFSTGSYSLVDGDQAKIGYNAGKYLQFTSEAIRINDDQLSKGAVYNSDYSTNGKLDNRWIPDWGAVKSIIPDVTGYIPYIGADQAADFGNFTTTSQNFQTHHGGGFLTEGGDGSTGSLIGGQLALNSIGINTYDPGTRPSGDGTSLRISNSSGALFYLNANGDIKRGKDDASVVWSNDLPLETKNYGAKGDAKLYTDGSTTAGSTTITLPTANLTSSDIGKTGGIPYGGTDTLSRGVGKTHVFKIVSITDSHHAVIDHAVTQTIVAPRSITVSATIGSSTITLTSGAATKQDIGKKIIIPGAGPLTISVAGTDTTQLKNQECYILNVPTATTLTVSKFSLATTTGQTVVVPGAWVEYGTDDTQALQKALDSASFYNRKLSLNTGRYLTTSALKVKSQLNLSGAGWGNSIISPVGYTFSAFDANNKLNADSTTYNVSFKDFEIDGSGVRVNLYNTAQKALYLRPVTNFFIDHVYVHNTSATGIGTDFLKNYAITNNLVEYCGLQLFEPAGGLGSASIKGAAGIGIGHGISDNEFGIISGNVSNNNGNYGIFLENQSRFIRNKGPEVYGNHTSWTVNNGFGDLGNNGAIFSDNYSTYDKVGLNIGTADFLSTPNYARNGLYNNMKFNNDINGIVVTSDAMGQKFDHITIIADSLLSPQEGFKTLLVPNGVPNDLTINNVTIENYQSKGISIEPFTGTPKYGPVIIRNSAIYNTGLAASQKAGVRSNVNISNYIFENNISTDKRIGAFRSQNYGFQVTSGTIDNLTIGNNYLTGNITGNENIAGTITTTVRRPAYEFAGTWTANQTFSGNVFLSSLTANTVAGYGSSKQLTSLNTTGVAGSNVVLSNTPTITSANLAGTPTATTPAFSTTATGIVNQAYLPTAAPSILATITGINTKTTGSTALYTVPAGKTLIVTGVYLKCTAATAITAAAQADVGVTAASVYTSANIAMTTAIQSYQFPVGGVMTPPTTGQVLNLNINTAATGTSQTIMAVVVGFLF